MNPISPLDMTCHKSSYIDLRDVWEDIPSLPAPCLKPFQEDLTYGRARGNTWVYQSKGARSRKRMDKLLYTGSVDTEAPREAQDFSGKIGRLGIGLKTKVEVLAFNSEVGYGCMRETVDGWVSDIFGIVAGIRVH